MQIATVTEVVFHVHYWFVIALLEVCYSTHDLVYGTGNSITHSPTLTCNTYIWVSRMCIIVLGTAHICLNHQNDVIMSAIASQITNVPVVCATVCLGADQNKVSKFRVTGLCKGIPPMTGGFPSQRASDEEKVFIWWRSHECTFLLYFNIYRSKPDLSLAVSVQIW